jgi:hypothetical protein
MHWKETTNENIKTLRRIVALLLSLAGLAERAAGRSAAVRIAVLWLLWPAEAIASDYVEGLTGAASPTLWQSGPDAAMRLAAAFRALATALGALVAAAPVRATVPRPRPDNSAGAAPCTASTARRDSS